MNEFDSKTLNAMLIRMTEGAEPVRNARLASHDELERMGRSSNLSTEKGDTEHCDFTCGNKCK